MSLADAVNVSVETALHRAFPILIIPVEAGKLPSFHLRFGICFGHVYEAVQVTLLACPSRNSSGNWIVKGEMEPKIQIVNVKIYLVSI